MEALRLPCFADLVPAFGSRSSMFGALPIMRLGIMTRSAS
jgi:hypothetical protein